MRELPILFSTEMGTAILEGWKTMTRRICKELDGVEFEWGLDKKPYIGDYIYFGKVEPGKWGYITLNIQSAVDDRKVYLMKTPYQPGDHLWVRETWRCTKYNSMDGDLGYEVEFKDGTRKYFEFDDNERFHQFGKFAFKNGWQSPYFMPKEAARIWLEVTDVRVERLQEITEEDAMAEGVRPGDQIAGPNSSCALTAKQSFMWLWQSLNDKRGYGWLINPWVWVISFKRIGGTP
jgi:hypothetical protein